MAQTAASELVALTPVIVGGAIALLGGVVVAIATHFFALHRERVTTRRARLEQLVTAAHELSVWLKKYEGYCLFGQDKVVERSPMTTIMTFVGLYWPALRNEARTLDNAVDAYVLWLLEGAKLRLAAIPPVVPNTHLEKAQEVYPPVAVARKRLIEQAEFLHEFG